MVEEVEIFMACVRQFGNEECLSQVHSMTTDKGTETKLLVGSF
jgi:hypothetical protein